MSSSKDCRQVCALEVSQILPWRLFLVNLSWSMDDNTIISAHVEPAAVFRINCQVVTMHLMSVWLVWTSSEHVYLLVTKSRKGTLRNCLGPCVWTFYLKMTTKGYYDGSDNRTVWTMTIETSLVWLLGSLLTKEARLITEEGTIRTLTNTIILSPSLKSQLCH